MRRWWALAALVLSVLTLGFDTTILNVALPTLGGALHASNSQLQWMADAYVLVFAGLLLPAGALGDRYGRKLLMVVGLVAFGAASAVGALVDSPAQLIMVRAVMGVARRGFRVAPGGKCRLGRGDGLLRLGRRRLSTVPDNLRDLAGIG